MLIECNAASYNNSFNFLNSFYAVKFYNVAYPQRGFCPLVFKNTSISLLEFSDVTNSFLKRNLLRFTALNESGNCLQMKKLGAIYLSLSYVALDASILVKCLFSYVTFLRVHGVIESVGEDTFKGLSALKNMDFQLDNFKEFFHSGTKWMSYLNEFVRDDRNNVDDEMFILRFFYLKNSVSFDHIYAYPDEDMCLFKHFPHARLVIPLLVPGRQLECTCTLKWLQLRIQLYASFVETTFDYSMNYQEANLINKTNTYLFCNESLVHCDFESVFNNCESKTFEKKDSFFEVIF